MKKYCALIVACLVFFIHGDDQEVSLNEKRDKMMHFYENKPVLITGGAGFIGSYLCELLVDLGAHVTVMDDLSTGNLDNIQHIADNIKFIQASITDRQACIDATEGQHIIFHLAAFISVPESIEKPDRCHEINVNGLVNILEAARLNGVKKVVFSSSAAIYGNHEGLCTENMHSVPTSPYGMSKRIGELYCQQYSVVYGIDTVCLRYFNVYGARQNPNGPYAAAVARFKHQMSNNLPITIFGDGMQTRDFIPVEEVALANATLAMLEGSQGEIFNVATGKSVNLFEIIEMLKQDFPAYSIPVTFAPARLGDVKHSSADCSKYREVAY